MPTKKKYKKLTNAEKKLNKEVRDELREKGIIPPIKPRLNRKKFAAQVIEEFRRNDSYNIEWYIFRALGCMMPLTKNDSSEIIGEVTSEQIGVLKVIKIALITQQFEESLKAEGKTNYSFKELYNKLKPILDV